MLEISGMGTALPSHHITQVDAAAMAQRLQAETRNRRAVLKLYQLAGVGKRHSVLLKGSTNGTSAEQSFYRPATSLNDRGPTLEERMQVYESMGSQLGVIAARRAISRATVAPCDVTHLITVSCTGFAAPGFDIELCDKLDLRSSVARTHIGFMGCHAMLNALRVAGGFVADPAAVVLVCAVELCSLHQQYGGGADQIVSNALFGDGAAAMVCRQPGHGSTALCVMGHASQIVTDARDQMTWKLGNHGFEMTLSPQLPTSIRHHLGSWLVAWLAEHGRTLSDVHHWAVHPGGPRILDAIQQSLQLAPADLAPSRDILLRYGNMSSPTVAFVLDQLCRRGLTGPCVMLGFGPGLTMEAALVECGRRGIG